MEWIEPKVNWTPDDYINVSDFNRIRGNIEYLKSLAEDCFSEFEFSYPLSASLTAADYAYASTWNNLEDRLQDVMDHTFALDVGETKTYTANESYIDYEELNRLESACLRYKNLFDKMQGTSEVLSFTLGNYGGIRI